MMSQQFKYFCVAVVLFCSVFLLSGKVTAQTPGGLDPNFGVSGKAFATIGNGGAYSIAVQPDGKIVAVGVTGTTTTQRDFLVARFTSSGTLDTTFDGDGYTGTDFDNGWDEAYSVALQANGKIVVVGRSGIVRSEQDAAIARYNSDGSLDTTFDGDGRKIFAFTSDNVQDLVKRVAILPDGKILISGHTYSFATNYDFALARLNADGSFDSTFGTNGVVTTAVDGGNSDDRFPIFVLQPDGKIIVTGESWSNNGATRYGLLRFNQNGTLDNTFGTGGKVVNGGGQDLALQSDGKIVTAFCPASCVNENSKVRRYNSDGSLDANFGTGGVVDFTIPGVGWNTINALAVQPDNKIILAGSTSLNDIVNPDDWAVARLTSNGEFDGTFGFNGRITTEMERQDYAKAVVIQPDGKILIAGSAMYGSKTTIARYDAKSDLALFRNNGGNGLWSFIRRQSASAANIPWGVFSDKIAPADFNGDCRTDLVIFRDGNWWILNSVNFTVTHIPFGQSGDIPVPADYDGDNIADAAVYRQGNWYIQRSRDGFIGIQFGLATDKPVPGDYDGDNKEDLAVFRDGNWYLLQSTAGFASVQFGAAGDKTVVGDYDGDLKTDIAVFRPSNGSWYVLRSTQGFLGTQWGNTMDVPVPADYDGDGKTDFAVYRSGIWYLLQSTQGFSTAQFGGGTDVPISSAYVQ
jgi:uncharacterized delta-60 repeat protein